ncbi:MAG: PAS domain-containing protein [Gammaproteobacteria bacterium]|nr:MAG: PAS domain-containing protein [Gammaproteobacteria bacterium]
MLDQLATAVLVADAALRLQDLNPAAELLLGASARQARGRPLAALGPGLAAVTALAARCLEAGQPFGQELEISPGHQEHQQLPVIGRATPFRAADGPMVLLELLDMSQSRQLDREKHLISQRGASRRMIRQLAHEIRNPLGGLRGAAQLLERELDRPALKEYTQVIIGEADRLTALTDALLGPTRQACMGPVNIHEVTERVRLLLAADAPPGVTLDRDYDPSLPPVSGDLDQLVQALLNVGRNALQAVGEQGRVNIRTRALHGYVIGEVRHRLVVTVDVEDDGPGIPPELADSIFYPLVSGRDGGTGLGLPLAQDLLSRHGGLIEFESEPGRTVFMLRIPVEAAT